MKVNLHEIDIDYLTDLARINSLLVCINIWFAAAVILHAIGGIAYSTWAIGAVAVYGWDLWSMWRDFQKRMRTLTTGG